MKKYILTFTFVYFYVMEIAFTLFYYLAFLIDRQIIFYPGCPPLKGDHKGSPLRIIFDNDWPI